MKRVRIPSLESDRRALALLRRANLRRSSGIWRFGAARIGDCVVDRLVARGKAASDGDQVWLVSEGPAE